MIKQKCPLTEIICINTLSKHSGVLSRPFKIKDVEYVNKKIIHYEMIDTLAYIL